MVAKALGTNDRLGVASSSAVVAMSVVYAAVLAFGLATLPDPAAPISGPAFALMELLIILLAPAIVLQMVAIAGRAEAAGKPFGVAAVSFAAVLAGLTSAVHFVLLTVGRAPEVLSSAVYPWLLSFRWPSVFYALDILAWDVFFPLAALCAAMALWGSPRARAARWLLLASSALAFAGLAGAFMNDMSVRNIGTIGYAVVYPVASGFLVPVFQHRDQPT